MDYSQFAGADRDGADLSGVGESRGQGGGIDVGDIPGHVARTMPARGRLFYGACGSIAAVRAADGQPGDGDRFAGRVDHGEVVFGAPSRKLSLHTFSGD